ncbi:regulator of sigma E protease [Marchantia polymorpha subsp. ruderalis]|uniref:PDZ domain-containing protein n=1 Tax=Marchantia polymorpha TaxID=3197 RepID=A0A2R6WR39_MARPO|nr:hypothetical protein MARPO_0064s0026 [Marchantia polymorpha]BBN18335.1 hypothetical protein Mp_8g01730 [Marchantia polymorpha subsp. ruderalis]|eukprot:PTQ36337.1 hypothetical protein MARPO_0064s0026 [Marchantia polymorpha]
MATATNFSGQLLIPPPCAASATAPSTSSFSRYSSSFVTASCSANFGSGIAAASCSRCGFRPLTLVDRNRLVSLDGQLGALAIAGFKLSRRRRIAIPSKGRAALCSAKLSGEFGPSVRAAESLQTSNGRGGSEAPFVLETSEQEQELSRERLANLGLESLELREHNAQGGREPRPWLEELRAIWDRGFAPRNERRWIPHELAAKGVLLAAIPGMAGLNLEGPQSVLQALGVLAAIITVHETGHFMAARLQNIHVTKFAVGFGPTLAKFNRKGVEYSLRTFPFGGFVAFPDDDPNSDFDPEDPNLLKNRPIRDRAIVISAGVIANLIFAYTVLFTQTLSVGLLEQEMFPGVMVPEVIGNSAAFKAGMKAGDVVLGVDGYQFTAKEAAVFELVDTIKKSGGKKLSLNLQRGPELVTVDVTPDKNVDGSGRIGVQLSPNAKPHRVKAKGLPEALALSSREFSRLTATVVDGLKQIVFNFEKTVDNVSGPVAIVAVGAEVARNDIAGLFQFAAIVNINLAIVNLLPLPALDGGYLAFVALEAIRGGKKLPEGVEQGIMSSGVLLLLMLGVVLMVRDTLNLGFVQQML